jgi:hypothetical protein
MMRVAHISQSATLECRSVGLALVSSSLKSRAALRLESVALRHQIGVLQRAAQQRLRLNNSSRLLWIGLSRVWTEWRSLLVIVKPDTVIAWHRNAFRKRAYIERVIGSIRRECLDHLIVFNERSFGAASASVCRLLSLTRTHLARRKIALNRAPCTTARFARDCLDPEWASSTAPIQLT